MRFPDLFERVIRKLGRADVYCTDYPELRDPSQQNPWILRVHNGVFDLGGEDRGEWVSTHQFETEEAACEYSSRLSTPVPPGLRTRRPGWMPPAPV